MSLSRRNRWLLIILICTLSGLAAAQALGWMGWVQGWVGALFKALSGGAVGYAVSRYAVGLDLSQLPEDRRPVAALSQAILIGAFALAVGFGT